MKCATWNVNSVRARMGLVLDWLKAVQPDVLLMQEIKCETEAFPAFEFQAAGYQTSVVGQKSYNGVAIVSRHPIENILTTLPGDPADTQARYIEATIQGVRFASLYLPNGNPVDSDKFPYKLAWMQRLVDHADKLLALESPVVLGGDFNIIPEPIDVYDIKGWEQDALYRPESRLLYRKLLTKGFTEAFRALHPLERDVYTFWDYQAGAWPRNLGLRIDHFLLSPEAADRLVACEIDKGPRGLEKASDHTPLVLTIL